MKKLGFAITGAAALALAACSGNNDDAVNNAELNQPAADDLNALADDAAANAENAALGTEQPVEDQNAAADANEVTPTDPSDADEQNVSGM